MGPFASSVETLWETGGCCDWDCDASLREGLMDLLNCSATASHASFVEPGSAWVPDGSPVEDVGMGAKIDLSDRGDVMVVGSPFDAPDGAIGHASPARAHAQQQISRPCLTGAL